MPLGRLRYVWPILLVAVMAWALFWRPSLRVQEHGITVENVFRTYFVPWPAIRQIDTRYSLTLHTSQRRVTVWAAPAPGRHRTLGLARQDFEGIGESARGEHGSLPPGRRDQHADRQPRAGRSAVTGSGCATPGPAAQRGGPRGRDGDVALGDGHRPIAALAAATVIGLLV